MESPPEPARAVEAAERYRTLLEINNAIISDLTRELVLLLRDMEELSNEEAAEVVGESVACVKSRLHRARMALREELTRALAPALQG